MGLFDTISNVFFEEEQQHPGSTNKQSAKPGPATSTAQVQLNKTTSTSSRPAPSSQTNYSASGSQNSEIDQNISRKFSSSLQEALEKANLPGFDFFEFHQLYNRFIKDGKSDHDAIKTALTSAETMRVDKNTLISNFAHYKKILDEQKRIFESDLKDFFNKNIQNPKQDFTRIEKDINEKEKLIAQYTQDIANLKNDQVNLGIDVEKAELQIEKVGDAFQHAYDIVHDDIKVLNEKLKTI